MRPAWGNGAGAARASGCPPLRCILRERRRPQAPADAARTNEKAPRRGASSRNVATRYFLAAPDDEPACAMKLSNVFSATRNQRISSFWNADMLSQSFLKFGFFAEVSA